MNTFDWTVYLQPSARTCMRRLVERSCQGSTNRCQSRLQWRSSAAARYPSNRIQRRIILLLGLAFRWDYRSKFGSEISQKVNSVFLHLSDSSVRSVDSAIAQRLAENKLRTERHVIHENVAVNFLQRRFQISTDFDNFCTKLSRNEFCIAEPKPHFAVLLIVGASWLFDYCAL